MFNFITLPFAALLRFLYSSTRSYGVAIFLFAVVVKLVILPFQMKSKKSMVRMGRLSGKQQELQKQYAKNQQKYQEELQKLYQEEGINPMGGCLWSFLPLLIMLPLYQIIYRPITAFMGLSTDMFNTLLELAKGMQFNANGVYNAAYEQIGLANFIHQNWGKFADFVKDGLMDVNFSFLGLNLSDLPTQRFSQLTSNFSWQVVGVVLIPIIAAGMQLVSSHVMAKSNGQEQQGSMKMMNLMMPLMSLWFCFMMPAAMGLYWIINSVLMMAQEAVLGRFYTRKLNAEEDEREAKREAARKLRMEEAKLRAAEREKENRHGKQQKPQPKSGEKKPSTNEAGRVGDRPYARGRSYQADRYEDKEQ